MSKREHDEIDLIEIAAILWRGKWIILALSLCSYLFGKVLVQTLKPQHLSRLNYQIAYQPTDIIGKVQLDFEEAFFPMICLRIGRRVE